MGEPSTLSMQDHETSKGALRVAPSAEAMVGTPRLGAGKARFEEDADRPQLFRSTNGREWLAHQSWYAC